MFGNVRLLLLSGIGKPYDPATGEGVVGRNYAYQTVSDVSLFFEDKEFNRFMGAGALGTAIDEFNGDNFDHAGLGFIGGGHLGAYDFGSRPIASHPVPAGHAALGLGLEEGGRALLQPLLPHRHPRRLPELSRQLPRPRPDLPRRLRAAAACA